MGYAPYELGAILIPYNEALHLFAVMNDPCADGLCLLLMVTSIKPKRSFDGTCILNDGDHEFLRHQSYIAYRIAQQARAVHIGRMVDQGFYQRKEDWEASVFNRIAAGLYASPETARGMIKYAQANNI